jgi:hypothetical protein
VLDKPRRRPFPTPVLAAAFFFLAASVAMTWPLATDLGHRISDPGDPYLSTWILHWDWTAILHHPFSLFNANIFHPSRLTLAFSETLLGVSVFGFPLYSTGVPPLLVHNVLFLLGMTISGFGAWALAYDRTNDALASLVAGVAYAFTPFRLDQLPHIQMQWGGFLPLFLLFLFRFLDRRRTRDLALFAVFFVANGLACIHYAIFGGIALGLTACVQLTRLGLWRDRQLIRRLAVALIICGAVLAPFIIPYALVARFYHFRRGLDEMTLYSAHIASFLSAGFRNKLFGSLTARFAGPEAQLFPGFILLLFAILGVVRIRRSEEATPGAASNRRRVPMWIDAVIVALVLIRVVLAIIGHIRIRGLISIHEPYRLSMLLFLFVVARCAIALPRFIPYNNVAGLIRSLPGPHIAVWGLAMTLAGVVVALGGRFFLYRELFEMFPFLLGAIRCPARGIVLTHLGLGLLAASGLSSIRNSGRWLTAFTWPILAVGATLFEYRAAPLDLYRADAEPLPVTQWLATRNFSGGVLELPMKLEDNFEYVYRVTQHNHPILNGYGGFFPKDFLDLQSRFASTPVPPDTMSRVRTLNARLVIFHAEKATNEELSSIAKFLEEEKRAGELRPTAYFHDRRDTSLVFEIPSAAPIATSSEAAEAEKSIDAFLANPGEPETPPYGWFDTPVGPIFHGGVVTGRGWAASDSGIDRIEISLDGRVVGFATYGFPRPDVIAAKPQVPCKALCGYRYRVVNVPAGRRVLSTRFIGKNGKDVTLPSAEIWISR